MDGGHGHGPFLGTLNTRGRIMPGTQRHTILGRPLGHLIFSLMASIRDPIY